MIRSLHIEHYALIDQLDIKLNPGFSVITGETGAGKSIILGAIGLLLGSRADHGAIKQGEQRCMIEAEFDTDGHSLDRFFSDNDLDFDGHACILRRELTQTGKSRAFINDTPVTLTQMKALGDKLIDIHSQHQNLLLAREDFQLETLDLVAQNSSENALYSQLYNKYKQTCADLETAIEQAKQSREEEDYLRFQFGQLAEANLKPGEQQELENEQETLSHAEEIKTNMYAALNLIERDDEQSTLLSIKQATGILQNISHVFSSAANLAERLQSCQIELKDIAEEIAGRADDVEYNPERLQAVDERLNTIYTLEKKHHVESVEALIEIQDEIDRRLQLIDQGDEQIQKLTQAKADALKAVTDQADILTKNRQKAKTRLEKQIVGLLQSLGMPNVAFKADMTPLAEPRESGADKVTFMFSANKNVEPQPLSQIASGGEIARVMLSLKALISGAVQLPTIIFDEIDTGVSGSIAEKMAGIMHDMACQGRQVISITHLPQIAAQGQYHYKVYKEDGLFATTTHITQLNDEGRINEIAHMLSGATITQAALNNAKTLLGLEA